MLRDMRIIPRTKETIAVWTVNMVRVMVLKRLEIRQASGIMTPLFRPRRDLFCTTGSSVGLIVRVGACVHVQLSEPTRDEN